VGEMSIVLEAREGRGKEFNRKLRVAGRVPAVVYGGGKDPVAVSLDPVLLERQLKASHAGINTLFDLEGPSNVSGRTILVKELQREPVRRGIVHVDLFEVDQTQRIHVAVPVHLEGTAEGLLQGGIVEHALREVELLCLPSAIPDEIVLDITRLQLGDTLHMSDLQLPTGTEFASEENLSIVSLMAPKAAEVEVAAEAEEVAEGDEAKDGDAKAEGKPDAEAGSGD
jgi:large subunit ribosomal protein L25